MSQALDPIAASYMAVPQLTVATGYNARVLVPQGTFYDPFFPIAGEGDDIWLNMMWRRRRRRWRALLRENEWGSVRTCASRKDSSSDGD